jgi:pimeloyl-ACP methyl ester carboxylesterase
VVSERTSTRVIDIGELGLVVDEAGAGGRPLLLVHGYTGGRNDFEPLLGPLAAAGWHVVAPDLRGHGDSDDLDLEESYSLEIFAGDLLALTDRLGWREFVLWGHSMGGMVAQVLTLAAPERVRGLVLMDTTHRETPIDGDLIELAVKIAREEGLERIIEIQRDIEDPLETPAYRHLCETVPGFAERSENNTRACAAAMFVAMALELTSPHDRLDQLGSIACPTLVLVGEEDAPFVEPSKRMAATIPGSRLAILAEGGHSPQFEAPDALWQAVTPFLADLLRTGPPTS